MAIFKPISLNETLNDLCALTSASPAKPQSSCSGQLAEIDGPFI